MPHLERHASDITPPWTIDEQTESFIVRDAKGQALAYIYFEDQPPLDSLSAAKYDARTLFACFSVSGFISPTTAHPSPSTLAMASVPKGHGAFMPHDVFISYSSKDKPSADATCAVLESKGIRCWIAPRDITPGADWGESIVDALHTSRVLVLVFSANAKTASSVDGIFKPSVLAAYPPR